MQSDKVCIMLKIKLKMFTMKLWLPQSSSKLLSNFVLLVKIRLNKFNSKRCYLKQNMKSEEGDSTR